jgi:hypothetical protein
MSLELEGMSSEVEATFFDSVPEMSNLSLVAGDSEMTVSWPALSGFDMPIKDLKYSVFMNSVLVASNLESTEFVKTEIVNGDIHSFVVKATYGLIEAERTYTAESEPTSLSAFKAPDASTDLVVSVCIGSALLYLQGQAGVQGKDGGQVQAGSVGARCLRDQGAPGHPGAWCCVWVCFVFSAVLV